MNEPLKNAMISYKMGLVCLRISFFPKTQDVRSTLLYCLRSLTRRCGINVRRATCNVAAGGLNGLDNNKSRKADCDKYIQNIASRLSVIEPSAMFQRLFPN